MAGICAKHCGGGQVGGVRVESGWGRKRDTHRWRNSCLLAISPCPLALILRSMLSIRSVVIVGAYIGIMSSPLTRSRGRLRWLDCRNPGVFGYLRGSIEMGEAESGVKKETELLSVRAKERSSSTPVPPTPKASGTSLLDDPTLVLSPLA